ncbi:uncharacterized protein LOC120260547 isoform X1 [Dioscorea cayenensis subsp. rotundata]|uniref:Uncharacterized protein LOC120260547 isoform X1 n=1 Tax=Dioscorea cayennensis subsp. rotundata TaxID=55577 RepID=A0AB40B9Q4_DIOCR|nr:uncharacterized protein LOC120260547 isoform X1 [Dioscorea cayenensis subsp. rotundata]XP_039123991.1 uncharacterized protein LOC120260547 isoform X1 [Dioscorea cayenensis subsp. rotundata]XP_039123998.1 uncharacterized protein LOC120260547 isoform X1 [Dioscorea cayenensis subsp. rotundata]
MRAMKSEGWKQSSAFGGQNWAPEVADSSHEHAHQHINGCRGIRSLNWIPKDLVTSRGEYEVYDGENIFGHMAVCGTSHPYQLYSWLDFNPNIVTALNTDMKD